MASINTFLCVYDKVPITVTHAGATNKRENGPKFFIQARPNYPVQKLWRIPVLGGPKNDNFFLIVCA